MCNPLRDDGVSYGDYLEQLTYLIFLKMSDEYSKPPYKKETGIPAGYTWSDMNTLKGAELEEQYKSTLEEPGCRIIKKGEVYERKLFTIKEEHFKSEGFLDEVKRSYTDLINLYVKDEKNKLKVFERGGVYLATKKIGKNNPKAERMEVDNRYWKWWNETVDRALVADVQNIRF